MRWIFIILSLCWILPTAQGENLLEECSQEFVKREFEKISDTRVSNEIRQITCENDPLCKIVWIQTAGQGSNHTQLNVVKTAYLNTRNYTSSLSCGITHEFWLFKTRRTDVLSRQILWTGRAFQKDEAGYGFFTSMLEIKPGLFHIHKEAYRGTRGFDITIGLEPLHLIEEQYSWHVPNSLTSSDPLERNATWNWKLFSGKGESFNFISKYVKADLDNPTRKFEWKTLGPRTPYLTIPRVDGSGDQFVLGKCALTLGSPNSPGFTLTGKPPTPTPNGILRAVITSDKTLLIDIIPSHFFPAKNWMNSDHVEIWQAIHSRTPWAEKPQLYQWGIILSSGKPVAGFGKPPSLEVVKSFQVDRKGKKLTRLKVTFPLPIQTLSALSISYVASNAGKKIKYALATSQIKRGNPFSLSEVFPIQPRFGGCTVIQKSLEPTGPSQITKSDEVYFNPL